MNDQKKKDTSYKIIEIVKNPTVIYTDGVKEVFEAIYVVDKGVVLGRIFKIENTERNSSTGFSDEFVGCGFIPRSNIKQINDGVKRESLIKAGGLIKI